MQEMLFLIITGRSKIKIQEEILFGKYRVLSELGRGSSSTVYLAEHLKLKERRAIKCILKQQAGFSRFKQESLLLRNLKSPEIPMIYDVEEDDNAYYIIEEWIQGESLEAFVLHQKIISVQFICNIGIQIAEILNFLHDTVPYPVLYLDMKPEHIILCGNHVKLIDFGIATFLNESGNNLQNYGTPGFAAPEQLKGENLSQRTDIYCLGRILKYLVENTEEEVSVNLNRIIDKSLQDMPALRYEKALAMKQELEQELKNTDPKKITQNEKHLLYEIAVVGSETHIGTTHFAVSMTVYLNQLGIESIYLEENQTNAIRKAADEDKSFSEIGGIYKRGCFYAMPKYGEGVSLKLPEQAVRIRDYGTDIPESDVLYSADLVILISGGREWEAEAAGTIYSRLKSLDNLAVVCNHNTKKAKDYAKSYQKVIYCFPLDADPFHMTKEKEKLFLKLLEQEGKRNKKFKKKNNWDRWMCRWRRSNAFGACSRKLCSFKSREKDSIH